MQKDNKAIFTRITVVDRDLQLRGGGGGHPDPEIREGGGSVKKIFCALQASVWSKNKEGGWGCFLAPPLDKTFKKIKYKK